MRSPEKGCVDQGFYLKPANPAAFRTSEAAKQLIWLRFSKIPGVSRSREARPCRLTSFWNRI